MIRLSSFDLLIDKSIAWGYQTSAAVLQFSIKQDGFLWNINAPVMSCDPQQMGIGKMYLHDPWTLRSIKISWNVKFQVKFLTGGRANGRVIDGQR